MLRTLYITRFGAFTDRTFTLEAVTVFAGANQSGKSTLFDAIRIHAFAPERRGKANQALYGRYGDDTDVRLDWDGEPPQLSDAEFMNLFAVSAGNLAVDLDGDWLNSVKRSLFAGGIDPRNLIDVFGQLASERGTYAHMRRRNALVKTQGAGESRLEALQARRSEILEGLARQETSRTELKGLAARLGILKSGEAELAEEVARQERIAERSRWQRHLTLLDEIDAMERAAEERRHLAQDRTAELDELEQRQRAAEAARIRAAEEQRSAGQRLEGAQAEAARLDKELAARRSWRDAADGLEARLLEHETRQLGRRLLWGVLAVLLILLGAAAVVWSGGAPWGWGVLAVGGLLGPVLFVLPGWLSERVLLARLKDQWRNRLGGTHAYGRAEAVLQAGTLAGLSGALAQVTAELERLAEEHAARRDDLQRAESSAAAAEAEAQRATTAEQVAGAALRDWLAGMQVASRDAYRDRLGEFRRLRQRLSEADGRKEQAIREHGVADSAALRSAGRAALAQAEAEGVPDTGLPEPELKAKRAQLERLRQELGEAERRRHDLDRSSHGESERLVGRLGTLPDEIAAELERLRQLEAEIAALDQDRHAAQRALEVFQAVAQDEVAVLADLSASVAAVFARLSGLPRLPQANAARQAAVALSGLRNEEIRAVDRLGVARPVGDLSSGAQHLLYLALRLEMARRQRQGGSALLCLDEPFAFLDPERQLETLEFLREFLAETGWQLILFTNEPAQAERTKAVFPDCRVHALP